MTPEITALLARLEAYRVKLPHSDTCLLSAASTCSCEFAHDDTLLADAIKALTPSAEITALVEQLRSLLCQMRGHEHFDRTGRSGLGCEACHRQREVSEQIERMVIEALTATGSPAQVECSTRKELIRLLKWVDHQRTNWNGLAATDHLRRTTKMVEDGSSRTGNG